MDGMDGLGFEPGLGAGSDSGSTDSATAPSIDPSSPAGIQDSYESAAGMPAAWGSFEPGLTTATTGTTATGRGATAPSPFDDLSTTGTSTATEYSIGEPTRPDIQHDNGFLQDPTDPNNPTPIDTIAPTWDDRQYYAGQVALAAAGTAATSLPFDPPGFIVPDRFEQFLDSPNGIAAYGHFLSGGGADRTFSYDDFVADDVNGQVALGNAIADTQRGVEDLYGQIVADNPALADEVVTFNITSDTITVGSTAEFPYPATDDWQKAIGGHSIWSSAEVTVQPATTPGGQPTFSMDYTLHAEDRYNFNPNQFDIETGAPDALRGRLEQVGLAHQYDHFGELQRDVSWNGGDISGSTSVDGSGR